MLVYQRVTFKTWGFLQWKGLGLGRVFFRQIHGNILKRNDVSARFRKIARRMVGEWVSPTKSIHIYIYIHIMYIYI